MTASMPTAKYRIFIPEDPELRTSQPQKRFKESCDQCGIAKVKCGKERPFCKRCESRSIACYYSPSQRSRRSKSSPMWSSAPVLDCSKPASNIDGMDYFSLDQLQEWDDSVLMMDIDSIDFNSGLGGEPLSVDGETYAFTSDTGGDTNVNLVPASQKSPCLTERSTRPKKACSPRRETLVRVENGSLCPWPSDDTALSTALPPTKLHNALQSCRRPSVLSASSEKMHSPVPCSLEGISTLLESNPQSNPSLSLLTANTTPATTPGATRGHSPAPPLLRHDENAESSDCNRSVLSMLQALADWTGASNFHPTTPSVRNQEPGTPKLPVKSPGEILALHATIVNSISRALTCMCCHDSQFRLLLGVLLCKLLSWYKAVIPVSGNGFHQPSATIPPLTPPIGGQERLNISYNGTSDLCSTGTATPTAADDDARARAQLVLGRLHEIGPLITEFAARCDDNFSEVIGMGDLLRRKMRTVMREIVDFL